MTPATELLSEHPFAPFVRILGKGKAGTRSLSRQEAHQAFAMILAGEVEQLQLGAFLMLLRVKEESGEELAGFVDACRAVLPPTQSLPRADLDWSSYAGKRSQNPWFILSILLLAEAGHSVFIHGSAGHTKGRLYTEQAWQALGLPIATGWQQASTSLTVQRVCYMPLAHICPALEDIMQLKSLLGLRSPVNTLARMVNPLRCASSIQSIFHPAYGRLHQEADRLLGQPRSIVFKGDGGEVEVKPQADTRLMLLEGTGFQERVLPRTIDTRIAGEETLSTEPLRKLWRGEQSNTYGLEATLATATVGLLAVESDLSPMQARAQAEDLWQNRNRNTLH
ncbi:MAG: anthranilate phosphoribosyltransferase [Alcanivorax sp.]|jgi:anthranilate phosphoribosyltransferase